MNINQNFGAERMGSTLLASLDHIYETKCDPVTFHGRKNVEIKLDAEEERNVNLHLCHSYAVLLKVNIMKMVM